MTNYHSPLLFFPFLLVPFSAPSLISDYPNPLRDGQFEKCKMPRKSYLCDPDEVLRVEERQTLAELLDSFQERTKNDGGQNGCKKKGVTGAVALSKQPLYFEMNDMNELNFDPFWGGNPLNNTVDAPFRLLDQWELDNECHKAFLLTVPIDLFKFGRVAFYFATPILQDEINHLYAAEQEFFKQKRWSDAIRGLLVGIQKMVNDRHGTLSGDVSSVEEGGGPAEEEQLAFQQRRALLGGSTNLAVPSSSVLAHFMLSICTIFASVALTLGILWTFRGRIFSMRFDPLSVRFNMRTMDDE